MKSPSRVELTPRFAMRERGKRKSKEGKWVRTTYILLVHRAVCRPRVEVTVAGALPVPLGSERIGTIQKVELDRVGLGLRILVCVNTVVVVVVDS